MSDASRSGGVADIGIEREPAAEPATASPAAPRTRVYPYRQPFTWWLRNRRYLFYMIRELTPVPMAAWLILFLVEVTRLKDGPSGYQPLGGPLFVAVSVICLVFALWHSFTFLNLAGLIMRIPWGERSVPGRVIVFGAFAGFVVVTALIAGLIIWGGL